MDTKIIHIEVSLSIGFAGASRRDKLEVEVDTDATEAEIHAACQEAVDEWANNYIDYGYSINP